MSSRLPSTMKSDRLLWLALLIPVFLSGLSAQGATAVNQPPPVVRTSFSIVENQTENEVVGQLVEYGGANFRFVGARCRSEYQCKYFEVVANLACNLSRHSRHYCYTCLIQ